MNRNQYKTLPPVSPSPSPMNINCLIFTIEDCLEHATVSLSQAVLLEHCGLRTVIGLDRQDRERRPWLNSLLYCSHKA